MRNLKFQYNYCYSKKLLILLILLIFSLTKVNTIYSKVSVLNNGNLISINKDNIKILSQDYIDLSTIVTFSDDQKLNDQNSDELELVIFTQYLEEPSYNIIAVKNYFYFLNPEGELVHQFQLPTFTGFQISIIPYKCYNELNILECYYFISYVNLENKIEIYKYKISLVKNNYQNELINNNKYNPVNSLKSETISGCKTLTCQIMNYNCEDVFSCFYENETPNELVAVNFNITNNLKIINNIPSIFKTNNGCQQIESTLSLNKTKAFVCYIDYNNEYHCLFYDIQKNKWSTDQIFFETCIGNRRSLFENKYIKDTKEYLLSCYPNSDSFQLKRLDFNFNILKFNYGKTCNISISSLLNCTDIGFSSIIYLNQIKTYGLNVNCKEMEKQKSISIKEQCGLDFDYDKSNNYDLKECKKNEEPYLKLISDNNEGNDSVISGQINISKENVIDKFEEIIEITGLNKTIELTGEDYNLLITRINKYRKNQTTIDFLECEKILKKQYKISDDEVLTIIQLNINKKNNKSLTWQLEYAVYNSLKERLNLSYCQGLNLNINYTIKNSLLLSLDIELINKLSNIGINVFDLNDDFFNDICYSYGESNSDLTLEDRKNEIYQNYSLCDTNCKFEHINLDTMTISCSCKIKTETKSEIEAIALPSTDKSFFKDHNIAVIKCYKLVFNFKIKEGNLGFWIILSLIILQIPCIIHYFIYNEKPIRFYIFSEMKKNNYVICKNNSPPFRRNKLKYKSMINRNNNLCQQFENEIKKNSTNDVSIQNNKRGNRRSFPINKKNSIPSFPINKKNRRQSFHRNNKKSFTSLVPKQGVRKQSLVSRANLASKNSEVSSNFNPNIKIFNRRKKGSIEFLIDNSAEIDKNNSRVNNDKRKISKNEEKIPDNKYYTLIHIDANNSKKYKSMVTDYFLDVYTFQEATNRDTRSFWKILYISLLYNIKIVNFIILKSPLEIKSLRICLTIFFYSCILFFNTLFYSTNKISDKHKNDEENKVTFILIDNLAIILLSIILSFILAKLFKVLINFRYIIENVFRKEEQNMLKKKNYTLDNTKKLQIKGKINSIIKKLRYKNIIFICIELFFMLFLFYYVTAFCQVYKNTQISWLINVLVSILITFIFEVLVSFFSSSLYVTSISSSIECIFKIVLFIHKIL